MARQVGVMSRCLKSLDGLAYTAGGRNLKTWCNFEDWIGIGTTSLIWYLTSNGAGAGTGNTATSGTRVGILYGLTGTTATGRAGVFTGPFAILLGRGQYTFETESQVVTLSTAVEEFKFYAGLGDDMAADPTDGVYFLYDRLTNVNWLAVTASNGVRTLTNTGIAVAAGVYNKLKIIVNYNGTAAYFYINGVLVATNTLNIPTGAGRNTGYFTNIIKSAGLTARYFYSDWHWLHYDLTASR